MELRRALLLFAIVLGLAAIASTIARPPDRGGGDATDTTASPPPSTTKQSATAPARTPEPTTIEFRNSAKPQTHKLEQGRAATVLVDVETPGQVDIPSLGLTDTGEPLTPAMFEIFETRPGDHPIMVQPAASETLPTKIGTLRIVPAAPPS